MLRYAPESFEAGEADLYKDRAEEDPLRCAIEVSAHEANASKIWPREVLTDEADYLGRGVAEGRHSSGTNVGSCWRRARDLCLGAGPCGSARGRPENRLPLREVDSWETYGSRRDQPPDELYGHTA